MEKSTNTKNVQMNVQLMFPDHSKEFQCPICAKYFSRKFTLDAHMLIHKGEKPYPCPFCGKSFRQKGTLMRHKALHSAKSLFHCSLCNRGFRQKNVFLHHLKHRHNVSTETLDRRKYRTGLKDYQSIMDTLPPFVQADSTAIASSEKHLDAMLLQSIKKHVNNSCSAFSNDSFACESMIQSNANLDITKLDCMLNNNNLSFQNHENNSSYYDDKELNHNQETLVNEEFSKDIKPILSNTSNEVDTTALSDVCFNAPYVCGTDIVNNSSIHSSNNISSSNDFDGENLTCIPCQLNFTSKIEFKCHVKTHVQSVLLGDINSNNLTVSDKNINFKNYELPPISVVQNESENITNQTHLISNSTNSSNEICCPVKSEISNFNSNSSLIEKSYNSNTHAFESNFNVFKCIICKISFNSEETFKKHSEMHNSYDLLKFISKFLQGKKYFGFHQNFKDINNSFDKIDQVNVESINDNLKLVQKGDRKCYNKNVEKCVKYNTKCTNNISKLVSLTKLVCVQCDKKFSNKHLFEYHRQLHLSAKGFLCKSCNRKFSSKTLLLSHTRVHHMKTFVCCKCSKVFNYKFFFNSHYQDCTSHAREEMFNGSLLNFPLISIQSLSNSNPEGIIGIIPVCNTLLSTHKSNLKLGIPVMSLTHVKSLYLSNNLNSKAD